MPPGKSERKGRKKGVRPGRLLLSFFTNAKNRWLLKDKWKLKFFNLIACNNEVKSNEPERDIALPTLRTTKRINSIMQLLISNQGSIVKLQTRARSLIQHLTSTAPFSRRRYQTLSEGDVTALFSIWQRQPPFSSRRCQPLTESDSDSSVQYLTMTATFNSRRYQPLKESDSDSLFQQLTMTTSFRGRIYQSSQKATVTATFSTWKWQLHLEAEYTGCGR